jgi:hypothetical protein
MQAEGQSVALSADIQIEVEAVGVDALGSNFLCHV